MSSRHEVIASSHVPQRGPYSQAVRLGDLIFVAGQAGLDPATGTPVGSTFDLQARRAFENLRLILEDAGSSLDRVVKTTCFLAVPEAFDQLNALYAEYFPKASPVRSTPVVQLPRGLLFSIEAIAAAATWPPHRLTSACTCRALGSWGTLWGRFGADSHTLRPGRTPEIPVARGKATMIPGSGRVPVDQPYAHPTWCCGSGIPRGGDLVVNAM